MKLGKFLHPCFTSAISKPAKASLEGILLFGQCRGIHILCSSSVYHNIMTNLGHHSFILNSQIYVLASCINIRVVWMLTAFFCNSCEDMKLIKVAWCTALAHWVSGWTRRWLYCWCMFDIGDGQIRLNFGNIQRKGQWKGGIFILIINFDNLGRGRRTSATSRSAL